MTDGSEHYLTPYLSTALPALGLDSETYGPYVTGFADGDETDEDSMNDLIELLRASSETHGDDDGAWEAFRTDLIQRKEEEERKADQRREEDIQKKRRTEDEKLQKEIQLAQQTEEEKLDQQRQEDAKEVDAAKAALVAKYAYDESELYDADGNAIAAGAGDEGAVVSNRDVAAKMASEQRDKLKSANTQSKKAAREETARAKMDKSRAKDERRKRATKGERKR